MAADRIAELIDSLTPQEDEAVREFIQFIKAQGFAASFAVCCRCQ
jgi:hypothetical protein